MKRRNKMKFKPDSIGTEVELCRKCGYAKASCVCRWQTKKVVYENIDEIDVILSRDGEPVNM